MIDERARPRPHPDREDYYLADDVLHARLRHDYTRQRYVVVGDHPPERKLLHECPVQPQLPREPWRVELGGEIFTVVYATNAASGGEPGVLYYEFAERPGELFKATRCHHLPKWQVPQYASYGPSDKQRWLECSGTGLQAARLPKVRTNAHRNKEEAARLQALVRSRLRTPNEIGRDEDDTSNEEGA